MRLNKTILSILLSIFCSSFVFGQNIKERKQQKKLIIPQFKFTQIDSLVDDAIQKIIAKDSLTTVVASVRWLIGNYSEQIGEFSTHRNHFDIYIFNFNSKKCSVQKIDNFGFFKIVKLGDSKVKTFLTSYFNDMQIEKLNPKVDTIHKADGRVIYSQKQIDHQLLQKIKIVRNLEKLEYEYPANYSENKYNLLTYRFKFLNLVGELQKQYNKKKHKRSKVVYVENE